MRSLTWRARTFGSIVKRWSIRAILATTIVSIVIRRGVAGLVAVPGRQGVESLVWPLAGGLIAIVVAAVSGALFEVPELMAARPGVAQRATFIALTASNIALAAVLGGPASASMIRLRNDLGLLGLALASATLLPRVAAWFPPAVVIVVVWFFGPVGGGQPPHSWAVLLGGQRDAPAAIVTMTAGIGGVITFLSGRPGHARTWLLDS